MTFVFIGIIFFSIYNHIKLASELKVGCDYSLFKQGISPMWEDPRNENGGRWLLTLEKRHHRPGDIIDKFWLDVVSNKICDTVYIVYFKLFYFLYRY